MCWSRAAPGCVGAGLTLAVLEPGCPWLCWSRADPGCAGRGTLSPGDKWPCAVGAVCTARLSPIHRPRALPVPSTDHAHFQSHPQTTRTSSPIHRPRALPVPSTDHAHFQSHPQTTRTSSPIHRPRALPVPSTDHAHFQCRR